MRFGAFVPQGWRMDLVGVPPEEHWPTMINTANQIEKAGYESAWVYDHFHTVPEPTQEPTYEAWTLMAALAASTERIRLGQMCTCNSYRLPSYMAKVASSVDVISGGRLEFAIGAGWYEHEYLAYGYEFPKASVRIGQLREAVEIIKAMWTEDEPSFKGEYFAIDGAINQPKPLQQPHPPLWIAGGGEKLTLRVVATHADYANFLAEPKQFEHKSTILAQHCEAVGRNFDDIGRTAIFHNIIGSTEQELEAKVDRVAEATRKDNKWVRRSYFIGTPEKVIERLGKIKELGCVHVQAYLPDAAWGDGIDLFATEVIPALA